MHTSSFEPLVASRYVLRNVEPIFLVEPVATKFDLVKTLSARRGSLNPFLAELGIVRHGAWRALINSYDRSLGKRARAPRPFKIKIAHHKSAPQEQATL